MIPTAGPAPCFRVGAKAVRKPVHRLGRRSERHPGPVGPAVGKVAYQPQGAHQAARAAHADRSLCANCPCVPGLSPGRLGAEPALSAEVISFDVGRKRPIRVVA